MEYEKTTKSNKYFYNIFRSSVNFLQCFLIIYFVFLPDWPSSLNDLLFSFSVIGTANLIDIVCFFPDSRIYI